MQAPLAQPYRPPKLPQAPNRLRIFAGTSNPVQSAEICICLGKDLTAEVRLWPHHMGIDDYSMEALFRVSLLSD